MSNKAKTGERVGRGVLRSQKHRSKDKSQTAPSPTPRPTTQETITLASGEKRTVEIEATNDPEWNDLAKLAEGGGDLSLDQKDMTHRTIAAIVAMHGGNTFQTNMFSTVKTAFDVAVIRLVSMPGRRSEK